MGLNEKRANQRDDVNFVDFGKEQSRRLAFDVVGGGGDCRELRARAPIELMPPLSRRWPMQNRILDDDRGRGPTKVTQRVDE